MDRHKEKRLPPTPSGDRGNLENLGSPLGEGAYSHPRAAPAPPAPPAQASDPLISPSFPLTPLPGLNDYTQLQPQLQSRPQPPLRPAPWRTPTSPQRPPPGRLFDRALLSATPRRPVPVPRASRSGSLPSIHYSNTLGEQQLPRSPRPVTPHPSHGLRSPPSQYARSAIPPVPPTPVMFSPAAAAAVGFQLHRQQPSSTFSPPIPKKSPRRSLVENNSIREKRSSTVSRELDVLEEQLVGLRVGEARRGEYHGEARRGDYNAEARRRQSTNSIYSQASEGQGSVYAETYHSFMFGDHPHGAGEPSHKGHLNRPARSGYLLLAREPPQLFSPPTRTTPRTPTSPPPLESHYLYRRPNTPIAPPPIEPRASRLEGRRHRGEVDLEPTTSPTPIRTITATRITRKPARLRPVSTQQALRTPSPLSGTLKGPGPHVPDVNGDDDAGSGSDGGAGGGGPMFARELTASPEVMSSVAEPAAEEDERSLRGMVSRWSMDSEDLEDGEAMEVSPVSGSPTREVRGEAGQEAGEEPAKEPVQEPWEEHHEAQEPTQDSTTTSSSNSEPSPFPQKNEGTEPQKSEEPILPFNNLTTQLASLQASLNHLVSHATSVEAAFGQVREAMIALRQKATETLVDTQEFLDEIKGVEEELAEVRRAMKGKGKEKEVVHSGAGERQGTREEENRAQGERNDRQKGDRQEQRREREQEKEEEKQQQHQPETSPDASPKGPPRRPRRGPPSGPAPGGAEWV